MDTDSFRYDEEDDDFNLFQASALMKQALDLLDLAGEVRAAVHLQHAIDTLGGQLPEARQPH